MRVVVPAILALLAVAAIRAQSPDLTEHFRDLNGTFVLLNGSSGKNVRHNRKRAAERFAPCSTFKIPNTAILLESGTVSDPGFILEYDPALRQPQHWARDFDLRGAFKASALWYYQVMARRAGMQTVQDFLEHFRYGNGDVSGGLDRTGNPFWVDGSLRISADEQVDFLRRFYEGQLGLSDRTTRLTREIMVVEDTPSWRLSAKTGACQPDGEDTSNWYVGYVEKDKAVYYFALQMGARDYGRAYSQRVPIARAILTELGILK
ncbi:MAG TPA: penicillin-binding transpeptidase domain-containing protein [Vicinamibacterales bacterium]|nr:penicillin-binding transpeptidase domain-containing protein [Vicinamibacterales bacterium]